MTRVKIEEILDHLSYDIKRALEDSVKEILPESEFDTDELFREFKRAVYRKCSTWETVPDRYVEKK